eukprot:TRINITY_DN357_c0_g1_i1.p1 TRINITY_DN357_c0_g1~~TRINITY_DN357_c0_g1_i1.p1  ORF type:complete len:228 (-),score=34.12 TRINITY_DN357_c0_g1_i1:111-794(-)
MQRQNKENVYLFIPNLIGYGRVISAIIAFWVCFDSPLLFIFLYGVSAALDAVDGHAARHFNQSSRFGAVLDMVTDRCSTSCLIMVLGQFYPTYILVFLLLVALDITSHYAHLYSSLVNGSKSHKTIDPKKNPWLFLYYHNRAVLGGLCAGNEIFFVGLYLCHFFTGPFNILAVLTALSGVPMALKQAMNVVQLKQAAEDLVDFDLTERAAVDAARHERSNRTTAGNK